MASQPPPRPSTNGRTGSSGSQDSHSSFPLRAISMNSVQNGHAIRANRGRSRGESYSSAQSMSSSSSVLRHTQPYQPARKLKSQYPADSEERHVEYILVASFDIDKGPTMEHQYPGPISGDENMLAELMLPDQMHLRSEDWTIFFLHKDNGEGEEEEEEETGAAEKAKRQRREERRKTREDASAAAGTGEAVFDEGYDDDSDGEESDEDKVDEGPALIYVLNLVNTKKDASVKRGAVVKAMAICTRHSFLHIYKPLLLLALEEYFKAPVPKTLEALYNAVNAMDLSLLPRLSLLERHILQTTDIKDLFVEKFERMIQQRMAEETASLAHEKASDQGGDIVRSGQRYSLPRDTHDFESRVLYNSIPIPIKVPTAVAPETVGGFSIIKLIQIFSAPHTTAAQPFMLHPHLTPHGAFTHPILVLINAVLTQKRIIFLGHEKPSGEVAEAVLAACALVSGTILRGFTRHAFPYTDLTKIDDLLNVPGFIAGVTNPAFANHPEWWDLLCDISTGRMKISNRIEPAVPTEGIVYFQHQYPAHAPSNNGVLPHMNTSSNDPKIADPSGDVAFMEDVQRSIAARHGEVAIRYKWYQYISRFTRLTAACEEAVYGASALLVAADQCDAGAFGISGHGYIWPDDVSRARELGAFVWRIEGWRNTRSYYTLVQDQAMFWSRNPIRNIDISHHLDRLRVLKLGHEESGRVYLALRDAVQSYDEICQLLAATPEAHIGIFYIGIGLFHPSREVREATAELLERIREHEAGRHFWAHLGRFSKTAFMRVSEGHS